MARLPASTTALHHGDIVWLWCSNRCIIVTAMCVHSLASQGQALHLRTLILCRAARCCSEQRSCSKTNPEHLPAASSQIHRHDRRDHGKGKLQPCMPSLPLVAVNFHGQKTKDPSTQESAYLLD